MSEDVTLETVEIEAEEVGEARTIEITQQGPKGEKGDQGDQGIQGIQGPDGLSLLNGSGAPAGGLGVDGDFYIDTTANEIYGPKTGGAWGSGTSITGPVGPQGIQGEVGPGVQDAYQQVTYQASLTLDLDTLTSWKVEIELTGAMTLNKPLNPTDGDILKFRFVQDSTGGRILTLDADFRLGQDVATVTLSTAGEAVDYMVCEYNANDDKFDVIGFVRGY